MQAEHREIGSVNRMHLWYQGSCVGKPGLNFLDGMEVNASNSLDTGQVAAFAVWSPSF